MFQRRKKSEKNFEMFGLMHAFNSIFDLIGSSIQFIPYNKFKCTGCDDFFFPFYDYVYDMCVICYGLVEGFALNMHTLNSIIRKSCHVCAQNVIVTVMRSHRTE